LIGKAGIRPPETAGLEIEDCCVKYFLSASQTAGLITGNYCHVSLVIN